MNLTRDRLRSIGWAALLITCLTLLVLAWPVLLVELVQGGQER